MASAKAFTISYFNFKDGFYISGQLSNGICNYKTGASDQSLSINSGDFSSYGFGCGYMLNNHFGIQTGISMNNYHWVMVQNMIDDYYQNYVHQKSITLPLSLRFVSSKPNKVGVFATAGLQLCFLTQTSVTSMGFGIGGPMNSSSDDNSIFKNRTLMLTSSAGIHIPSNRYSIDIGISRANGRDISESGYYTLRPKFTTGFLQVNFRI